MLFCTPPSGMGDLIYVLFICGLVLFANSGVQHVLTIWITWLVFYKRQELLTLHEHLGSPLDLLAGSMLLIFSVFCDVLYYLFFFFALYLVFTMLPVSLDCPFFLIVLSVCPVPSIHNVTSVSGLSILLNCVFRFVLYLVFTMLPVSLYCPFFLIVLSVCPVPSIHNVASVSGLSILLHCSFGLSCT